jgi:hypothetical protein
MVDNGVITTVAGNGTRGSSGNYGAATSAQLNGPTGVAVDSAGNLYIAEFNGCRWGRAAEPVGHPSACFSSATRPMAGSLPELRATADTWQQTHRCSRSARLLPAAPG